jgi:aspartate/methionine/tyrosine aminotransferase
MVKEYRFCWGEPYCVREALKHYYKRKAAKPIDIDSIMYSPDPGNQKLIDYTRNFIKETTGEFYKYIIITHGTTSAINIALRVFAREGRDTCYTHKYYFPYYNDIIDKNGYKHKKGLYKQHKQQLNNPNTVGIVDSPSNPAGDLLLYSDISNNIIWDSVYHNPVFINDIPVKPDHRVNCGSYSKVLGLTGARVGWIATNNESDYKEFLKENLYENCTMSTPSQELIIDIFDNIDLQNFLRSAKYRVNNNREMFDRICYLFDGQAVPNNGMFYAAWATPYTYKLLGKLGIKSVEMDSYNKNKYLRFNLAQTNELTKKAIRYIIKEDRR